MGGKEYFIMILTKESDIRKIRYLFMLTYMVSYITRINYGAVILEIGSNTGFAQELLSLALTGSFLTYGVGQLISGYFGDKVQPKKLVLLGLSVTVLMNILIPLCNNPMQMAAVWCVNGFAQAFMWPPIVRLMVNLLSERIYKRETVFVSWGSSIGTILIYLISPLLISIAGWRAVFVMSAVSGLFMILIWYRICPVLEDEKKTKKEEAEVKGNFSFLRSPLLIGIMFAIVLQGSLRDGVTTWMPTYISETYQFSNGTSILTGVLLPIFSILSYELTLKFYRKQPYNPLFCAGWIFLLGSMAAAALLVFTGNNAAICIFCMALLTGCMHGVNLILICMVPAFFKGSGKVSLLSGVLNSCTYVGSAISTYGIAKISKLAGWNFTITLWIFIAAAGAFICFVGIPAWKKKITEQCQE